MPDNKNKTIWRRVGIILVLLPVCFFFPFILLIIGWLIWTLYEDLKTPTITPIPLSSTWRDIKADDNDWLSKYCSGCESPAEEAFLRAIVMAFNLKPDSGKLVSPSLTLEMQISVGNYRFDFVANGRQVIEIDGASWHSSPEQIERDRIRDEYSVKQGYSVLRIPAKIVFNTPSIAIDQVKAALVGTPNYTIPVKQKPVEPGKRLSFLGVVEDMNRSVYCASVKQSVLADVKSVINAEQILLEALVSEVESEIGIETRIKALSPSERRLYENNRARLEALLKSDDISTPSREDIFQWKEIIKPSPVDDVEIQEKIEKEYQRYIDERNLRLAKLSQRCTNDQAFGLRFRHKLEKFDYPVDENIFNTETKI